MKMLKVKANKKLNFGHLEGMPEGKLAYLSPGDVMELPECYIVNFYLKSGDLELIKKTKPREETTVVDDVAEAETVKDTPPAPKKKKKKGGK
ncbi:MAG: hypothetical protein DRN17_01000 [Thermoplasmata archaeon]|nr:MAG: hypothetical protein DRN17_01000 [Thermoplasmata archaeon]